ncbi:hypothetical protein CGCF415_v015604 [Colletotrichum fructicola]|nr:hypothetical protein CFRS1_v015227 [Colletotrichum fructicola]KAF4881329.1 hypothetical protein CGCFRS4_v015670 [Colletotrichum fructicola]KAF4884512.1 hypothetical protein CGCF415_v015604 [Colletotrichum fructicola]KAF4921689.1 hypothetical protein CGCF245_v015541 [Colletotrichum fructicola]KAF5508368.1 hypothetical protein CGCF413_v002919 [Colletotrichum fructicola]
MPAGPSLISDSTSTELQVYRVRTRRHSLCAAKGGSLAALLCYRGGYLSYRLPWSRGVNIRTQQGWPGLMSDEAYAYRTHPRQSDE